MPVAVKRMLLVTQNVPFAIDVKRALEALGEFSVATAANARNAIEYLSDNPADLLLLDTADLPISPGIMIELARARAADIAIVLAPDNSAVRQLAEEYAARGVVEIPVLARDLLPVLDSALATRPDTLPPLQATSPQPSQDTLAIESLVDDLTAEDSALNYTRRRLQASYELLHPPADEAASTAQSLVELEIAPSDDSDTVRFRTVSMADDLGESTLPSDNGDTVSDLAQRLAADPDTETELPATATYHDHIRDRDAFQLMLDDLLDESTQLDDLKIDSLFDTTAELPGALGTGAVPAWLRLTEQFIEEPGFLDDMLPQIDDETEEPADTTEPAEPQAIAKPAPIPVHEEETVPGADAETATAAAFRPVSSEQKDPLGAQLALTMTQAMTELTADGTVLTRGKRIHAYAGELPLDKLRALRRVISDDWAAQGESSRVRFVRIPDDGADYLLYSRATIADYCLTMIFSGGKQLREIRRQGESLANSLAAAPTTAHEAGPADEPAPAEAIDTQPFAFVWLLADVDLPLSKPVAQQLLFWLELQLNALGWTIHRLDVHGDFIHLYADVPGDASPDALIRDVMERSRQIACAEDRGLPGDLWADAYLVVQPGRAISERELGRFLQFARA